MTLGNQEENLKRFRDNLLRISGERNMSQSQIAKKMNVPKGTVWHWFRASHGISAFTLPRLAKSLGCTVDELLEGIE